MNDKSAKSEAIQIIINLVFEIFYGGVAILMESTII